MSVEITSHDDHTVILCVDVPSKIFVEIREDAIVAWVVDIDD